MKKNILSGLLVCLVWVTAWGQEQDTLQSEIKMHELMEIVVKGNLPNTRLKGNAMITRIEGTSLAASGTLGEMLVKVPGMTGTEDSPEVLGKGAPLIYVNGRLLRDASELKRLRSEDIRDVEVINNPGAQYDATVRAVVRIRTRRQQGDGLSLDLTATDDQDLRYGFNRPSGKLGLNYRTNGVDVFGSVYYFHQNYHQYSSLEEITNIDKVFRQNGPYTMTWKNDQLTYTAGVNWQINDQHSVGARADLTHYLGGTNMVIYDEDVYENDVLIDHLYSEQTSHESKPLGWLTNAYYNGTAGKLGIDFNFDFMSSQINTDRENIEESTVNDDFVLSRSGTDSHLYATKLVLSYPIWKGTLEAGTEMAFAKRHNTYWIDKGLLTARHCFAVTRAANFVELKVDKMTIANTDADITENNLAAFAEYSCNLERYGRASVGLRYEHTLYDYDDAMNSDYLHRSMDEFFPTASYSVTLGPVQAGLSYGLKTNRPSFFAMNDAVTYISRYSMQAGNSQLLNERLRDLTLNVSWRWLSLAASYVRCKNAITQWAFISDDDAALIKHINLERPVNNYSLFVSATPQVGIWSLNATAGVEKQDLYLDLEDIHVAGGTRRSYYDKPVYTLNVFNSFSLKHDWKFDINFMFRSRGHQLNFYNDCDNIRLGFVAQKSFLNKSLTLRAAVLDVLQRNRLNEYADMGYYQIQQNNRYSTHKLQFTVIYRLNATRSKYKGTGAGKDAQQRMRL